MARVDVMLDIETLGKGLNPPILQVSAVVFNLETGEILDSNRFDQCIDITSCTNIEGDTLAWWLNTNKELLGSLVNTGKDSRLSEAQVIENFCAWLNSLKIDDTTVVYLWGNGVLFDNRIIEAKIAQYNLTKQYPIKYYNNLDVRTILELGAIKLGVTSQLAFKKTIENTGTAHNALDDVYYQIKAVCAAYKLLMG